MARKRTSIIWNVPKEEFQQALDKSNSIVDVLKHFDLDPYSGNHKTIHARVNSDNLCLKTLEQNRKTFKRIRSSKADEDVFCENSNCCRTILKQRFLKLVKYECCECGIEDVYNGKLISLQIDHKNGTNNDNRIENLQLLCPNCHSQTATFSGKKNKTIKNKKYESCEEESNRIASTRKFNPSKEELKALVESMPMTKVGKHFGVSDNAIRKRCILLGISL